MRSGKFLQGRLDAQIRLNLFSKLDFTRTGFSAAMAANEVHCHRDL
jgi:hypothetical protein